MKKTLVSALTMAMLVGAASSTLAAANPFSDVPSDSWAYDAVSQLAADGVIEGYGDGTFRGQQNITRYEMAQMIAKAMAKSDVSAADKALIDKLAAEFGDELNNLGVRVANLERNADKIKWNGEMRYRYWSWRTNSDGTKSKSNQEKLDFRLYPNAEVNEHWHIKGMLKASTNMKSDNGTFGHSSKDSLKMRYMYVQGDYDNFQTRLGKIKLYSVADDGLVADDYYSGAQVTVGNKLKATLEAGRFDFEGEVNRRAHSVGGINTDDYNKTDTANYQGVELNYKAKKWSAGAAYRHFSSDAIRTIADYKDNGTTDDANIWSVGGKYRFDRNWQLAGAYAENTSADNYKKGGNVQIDYKGANTKNAGTWGMTVAYRHVGENVGIAPTYDTYIANTKGVDFFAGYVPAKNVLLNAGYFTGKQLEDDRTAQTVYGRVSLYF